MEVATKYFNIFQSLIPVLLSDSASVLSSVAPCTTEEHSEAEVISEDK